MIAHMRVGVHGLTNIEVLRMVEMVSSHDSLAEGLDLLWVRVVHIR